MKTNEYLEIINDKLTDLEKEEKKIKIEIKKYRTIIKLITKNNKNEINEN
jgi:hypothetical protein